MSQLNDAFTLECSFCGTACTLSSHLRISTPACRPPPARLGDIEPRRTGRLGSWRTSYSFQNPERIRQNSIYNALERSGKYYANGCLIVIKRAVSIFLMKM